MDEISSVKKPPMMAIFPEFQKTWATSKLLLSFSKFSSSALPKVNLPLVTSTDALVALITIQANGNKETKAITPRKR